MPLTFLKSMSHHNDMHLDPNTDVSSSVLIASANDNWTGFLENPIKHKVG